jgi:hypothetical protein
MQFDRTLFETFGPEDLEIDPPILEAFITEGGVAV